MIGVLLAGIYAVVAVFVVVADRAPGKGGNWITLSGMGSFIITLPVSAVMEKAGANLDCKSNLQMGFAIGVCAGAVYLVGWALESMVQAVLG